MGLLKLLTLPVSAPLAGGRWVLQTVLDEAKRRYYDPATIRSEIEEIERRHKAGEIGDAEFEGVEDALLQRLLDAREYQQEKRS
jgi:gas vesicle protein GvpG